MAMIAEGRPSLPRNNVERIRQSLVPGAGIEYDQGPFDAVAPSANSPANMDFNDIIDAFTITSRREIVFYLRQLISDKELVSVSTDEADDAFLTLLLDMDEAGDYLVFDSSTDSAMNRRLLESSKAYFVAHPVGVRNQFHTQKNWEVTYQGRNAMATRIPGKFIRFQRREFFRLTLPLTQRIPCQLQGEAKSVAPASIVDIGIGGLGLEIPGSQFVVEVGQVLPGTVVDLGKIGRFKADLEVQYTRTLTHGARESQRVGCRFIRLGNADEHLLQRFITKIQQDERARLG